MENVEKTVNKKSVKYTITDEICLDNITSIKNSLADHDQYNQVEIEMSGINNIDLSAIQLLESIKKSCQAGNKKFSYSIQLDEAMESLLFNAGIEINQA